MGSGGQRTGKQTNGSGGGVREAGAIAVQRGERERGVVSNGAGGDAFFSFFRVPTSYVAQKKNERNALFCPSRFF